jgi:hypothetical protein
MFFGGPRELSASVHRLPPPQQDLNQLCARRLLFVLLNTAYKCVLTVLTVVCDA